jgi:charged multivesicular body protein 2A
MSFLFGGATQVKRDPIRDYQRDLRHSVRSMEREDIKAASQERALLASISKHAKEQRLDLCKAKAKELVRLRAHRHRIVTMKGHMATLQHQLSTVQSAKVMQETMAKTTTLLRSLNTRLDAKAIYKMLMEFEKQSTNFSDGQEIVEGTLDDIFEADNEQATTDLGLEMEMNLPSSRHELHGIFANDANLEARLQNLKSS